jgi:D-aminopeptidase
MAAELEQSDRPRARDLGIAVGLFQPGDMNAITDVEGVAVGHQTVWRDEDLRTGVTVVLPHQGNVFQEKVPAAISVINGFGKLTGLSQVQELGVIETPIALTGTLSVWKVADAVAEWVLELEGNENVRSVNPVVGECNDGYLSDIRRRPVEREHVRAALTSAEKGPVQEGSIGAGTGTTCLGFKGGIGTASRRLPERLGSWTIGVLVQTNFGGCLTIAGVPLCERLGTVPFAAKEPPKQRGGSCLIVVATDAPLDARQLERLASRTALGLARTGSYVSNGSGDYAIAFSTHENMRVHFGQSEHEEIHRLPDGLLSPVFAAVVEATEEAVLNSMFAATTVTGFQGHAARELPIGVVREELEFRGMLGVEGGDDSPALPVSGVR